VMRDRVVTTHVHDNHGEKDEHLLPYEGSIDWEEALELFSAAPQALPVVIELKEQSAGGPVLDQVRAAFDKIEENLSGKPTRTAKS
jgi:sugar phosphate isomerase/epimerase